MCLSRNVVFGGYVGKNIIWEMSLSLC